MIHETAQGLSEQPAGMMLGGWIFLSVAWISIFSLAVFCYRRVLQRTFERPEGRANPPRSQNA